MARIVGINLPAKKRIEIGLTYIFGIGRSSSVKILEKANIDKNKLVENLSAEEIGRLKKIIEDNYKTGGELRRDTISNIKRLKDIGCYRGTRHIKRLPVRGQRTRTNSRTVRGNIRKTFGSGKRPAAKKT
ncbi:30S ribosomal protein S13 [Candidatus Parcubacteria bacterium 4484_255]|nr:MAG: 30S ribosomal protein S13 [Candidatus Parcubacteria bacterium 4484_255]